MYPFWGNRPRPELLWSPQADIGCHNSVTLNCELLHPLYFILIYLRTSFLQTPVQLGLAQPWAAAPNLGGGKQRRGKEGRLEDSHN